MDKTNRNDVFLLESAARWAGEQLRQTKAAFLSSLATGLLCYLYAMTNKLVNHDEVKGLFEKGTTVTSGRWALGALDAIFPNYSMPWINGLLAILLMAVSVCVLIRLLGIKAPVLQALFAGCVLAFPSLIGTFSYMFTVNSFALSFLAAVCAVWFISRDRLWQWILGLGCMVFSLGIYQSYISVAAGMLVVLLIRQLLEGEEIAGVFRRGVRFVVFLVLSLGLYYVATQVILVLKDVKMNDYASGSMAFSLGGIPAAIGIAYRNFFLFLTEGLNGLIATPLSRMMHGCALAATLILLFLALWKQKAPGRLALAAVLIAVLPLAANCMYLFTTESAVHTLVLYGFVSVYALMAVAAQVCLNQQPGVISLRGICVNVLSMALSLVIISNIYLANQCWLNLQLRYENAYAFYTSVLSDLRAMPEFDEDAKIALVGYYQDPEVYEKQFAFTRSLTGLRGFSPDSYSKDYFLRYYIGVDLPFVPEAEAQKLAKTEEVSQMPVYPYYGSIAAIGDTIVIKLS